jgi:hypothetical protein
MMADAWRDDRLTMQTLRDLYANLNHAEPGAAAAAGGAPPAAAREEARRGAERAVAGAVFELGLRQCSPKVIKGLLNRGAAAGSPAAELTTEHIKSHLQKYRQHHDRSRQPFRDHFERCLRAPAARAAPAPAAAAPPRRREALDAAVGRAPGVLADLAAARARLRRDVDAALAEHRRLADELAQLDPGGGGGGPS